MRNLVVVLALAWGNAIHIAPAMEPSIVLVTTEATLVYPTNNGSVELRERRANRAVLGDTPIWLLKLREVRLHQRGQ